MPRPTVDTHLNSKTIEHCRLGNSQWRHTGSRTGIFGLDASGRIVHCLLKLNRGILSQSTSNPSPSDKILHWLDCQLTLLPTCIRACRRFLIWCVRHCWRYWNVYGIPRNMSKCLIHLVSSSRHLSLKPLLPFHQSPENLPVSLWRSPPALSHHNAQSHNRPIKS